MIEEEKKLREIICEECKWARRTAGITQKEFARQNNLDRIDVRDFERGIFKVNVFAAYHKAYGITLEQFCEVLK